MNTISIKVITDSLELTAFLIVITLMSAFTQPALAEAIGQTSTLPNFCDANVLRAFPEMPGSLKCTPAPEPYTVDASGSKGAISPSIIKNKAAAIALGKMLFWDSQVGSDGLACASCHFQAGADNRTKNQINPGMRNASGEFASDGVTPIGNVFDFMASYSNTVYIDPLLAASASGKGANYTLKREDFPLRKYQEPETPGEGQPLQADRNAEVVYDSNDVISSQGVYHSKFNELTPRGKREICDKRFPTSGPDMPIFNVAGYSVRQVEPRNTPSVINAVYYFRNFWDGRANNVFNGLDPFGMRRFANPDAVPTTEIYIKNLNGTLSKNRMAIYNASLASQAVGPALSDFEMSCGGKSFPELGKKMLSLKPLKNQTVAPSDSVLGSYTKPDGDIKSVYTYKNLIQSAFNDAYWNVPDKQTVDGYKLIENNFSLFWGLAIQAYEATLVSNDSRFDKAQEDVINGRDLLTEQEQNGMNLFVNQGKCIGCHLGTEFTAASVSHSSNPENVPDIGKYTERMVMGDGGIALYDSGFYNIGVRPSKEDLGIGASDPYGFPLSFTRNAKLKANDPYSDNANVSNLSPDPFQTDSFLFAASIDPVVSDERDALDGAFKVPALRNVELTGPYFHNGGQATLEQVVQFYNRGGDRKDLFQKDTEGCGGALIIDGMVAADPATGLIDSSGFLLGDSGQGQPSNIAADMAGTKELLDTTCNQGQSPHETLTLSSTDVDDLVAFLKTLTDERVRWEKAPFDHPSLALPNGHIGDEKKVKFSKATNQAQQQTIVLPAVGAAGRGVKGLRSLQTFMSGLQ
jgi:cytochrome c peroxidase